MIQLLLGATLLATPARIDLPLVNGWTISKTNRITETPPAAGWTPTVVPAQVFVPAPGPRTALWYRRTVTLPPQGRAFLRFESAANAPRVFVDGTLVAEWMDGWSTKEIEITKAVRGKRQAVIEVRCLDSAATYADGFVRPPDAPDSALRGKVLWPLGGYRDAIGLRLPVHLLLRPTSTIDDSKTRILTKVRGETLRASGVALVDRAGFRVRVEALDRQGDRRMVGKATVGRDGTWAVQVKFAKPHLWSPEDPHLYRLVVTLIDANGKTADASQTRFGFREVWTNGPDFYLNGVKRHLLASSTWPASQPVPVSEIRRRLLAVKASNAIAFRLHIAPWQDEFRAVADEIGLLIVDEAPVYTDGSAMYAYRDPRFWANYRTVLKGMVDRSYNHPSVVLRSLGNETLFMGNASVDPDLPTKLGGLAATVRQLDPSRPSMYEADLDPGGAYDFIGLHYPHELPNQHAYPVICDWLAKRKDTEAGGGLLGKTSTSFMWDRKKPLYIGEYLWVPTGDYSPGTVFLGSDAYNDRQWSTEVARNRAWFDQTIAYRRAGVTGLCPWTAFGFGVDTDDQAAIAMQTDFFKPVAAYPRFRSLRVYAGASRDLVYDVFNDSPKSLDLVLTLDVGAPMRQRIHLSAGETVPITFRVRFAKPGNVRVTSRLSVGGRDVDVRTFAASVSPPTLPSVPHGYTVVKIDGPAAMTRLAGVDPLKTIAIVGSGVLDPPAGKSDDRTTVVGAQTIDPTALKSFAESGGTIAVMSQHSLASLGLPVQLVDHASTMAFADDRSWPSLQFWGADMLVARKQLVRNGVGGLRSLATSGGPQSLAQSPIGLMRMGKGRIVFVQALAEEKGSEDPAARETLHRALDLAVHEPQAGEGPVAVFGADASLRERLSAIGLDTVEGEVSGSLSGVVVLGSNLPESMRKRIREEHLPVFWLVAGQTDFATLGSSLGQPGLRFDSTERSTTWNGPDPLLVGVTAEELSLLTPPVGWDRNIYALTGTCSGSLVPDALSATWTRYALTPSRNSETVRLGDRLLVRRSKPVSTTVTRATAGWTPVKIEVRGEREAILRVMVNGQRREWLRPEGSTATTWLNLPAGRSTITLVLENAAQWGNSGPTLTLGSLDLGPTVTLPADLRVLSAPFTAVTWQNGDSTVVATTLRTDAMAVNPLKAERLLSAVCANLGMRFRFADSQSGDAVPLDRFRVESGAYNQARIDGLELRSAGSAVTDVSVAQSGTYAIEVQAESTSAAGEWSEFAVEIDGREIARQRCTRAESTPYHLPPFRLEAGQRSVRIRFTNDANVNGEDRNLLVRRIAFIRLGGT